MTQRDQTVSLDGVDWMKLLRAVESEALRLEASDSPVVVIGGRELRAISAAIRRQLEGLPPPTPRERQELAKPTTYIEEG